MYYLVKCKFCASCAREYVIKCIRYFERDLHPFRNNAYRSIDPFERTDKDTNIIDCTIVNCILVILITKSF